MSSIVYLRNSKTNTVYVYLNESTWDPETKKCVCKRKCIGHLDPETNEIVPNRGRTKTDAVNVKSEMLCDVFDTLGKESGLLEALHISFPGDWKTILSLAYYIATTDSELAFVKQWSVNHRTPLNKQITPEMVSTLLSRMSNNGISMFFEIWKNKLGISDVYKTKFKVTEIDKKDLSRAITLDAEIDGSKYGSYMEIYFESKNNTPICYEIKDAVTNKMVIDYDVRPDSFKKLISIMDEENNDVVDITTIPYASSNITARVYPDNEVAKSFIQRVTPVITDEGNYRCLMGTPLFVMSFMTHIKGKKYFAHVYYDTNKVAKDLSFFIQIIDGLKNELETGNPVPEHQALYDKYLIVKNENGKTVVEQNGESVMNHNPNAGFTVVVSNNARTPDMAIAPFLLKEINKQMFDNVLNDYDSVALNLYSNRIYLNRVFIQFIALIIRIEVENRMNTYGLNKTMSYKEVIEELSSIKTVNTPNVKKKLRTELNYNQRIILRAMGIEITEE